MCCLFYCVELRAAYFLNLYFFIFFGRKSDLYNFCQDNLFLSHYLTMIDRLYAAEHGHVLFRFTLYVLTKYAFNFQALYLTISSVLNF